ncbi:LysR family transcriptional regulator [Ramlibacter sp. G-1-2-2]|uniref:LysR family transcriptional regulator n=1 Tax=Ramlibacter agri TaxID=2728837 RepID=A0A848GYQ7_9BURK|nr:LysR family transcriptional regulator [Ramlibacter agri]NML42422.1 LysR family transcriptional regulator [Ramlibacter agri]
MLQLRQLKTFLAAAETLSFTRAAERVHLSQPSVTEQVQALEQLLGQPLFIRTNNKLALTAAGEHLAARGRELLALADETLAAVRDNTSAGAGEVRVAAPQTLCAALLAPLVAELAGEHPAACVILLECDSRATEQAVLEGRADFGLLHGWPVSSELQAQELLRDQPVALLAAGHPLAGESELDAEALVAFPVLLTPPGCRYRAYAETLLLGARVRPQIAGEAGDVYSLARMVAAGAGVAVLPRLAVQAAAASLDVEARALRGAEAGLAICLVSSPRRALRPAAAAFARMVRAAAASDEPMPTLDVQHRAGGVAIRQ